MIRTALRNLEANRKSLSLLVVPFFAITLFLFGVVGISNSVPELVRRSARDCLGDVTVRTVGSESIAVAAVRPELLSIAGIARVTPYTILKAQIESARGADTLAIAGIDLRTEPELKEWIALDSGALLREGSGDGILLDTYYREALGLRLGEVVMISALNASGIVNALPFTVVGFIDKAPFPNLISRGAMEALYSSSNAQMLAIRLDRPSPTVAEQITRIFADTERYSVTELSELDAVANNGFLRVFTYVIGVASSVVFLTLGLLMGIMSYISTYRRLREFGTYLAIGFGPRYILGLLSIEYGTTALVGGTLAAACAGGAIALLSRLKLLVRFPGFITGYFIPVLSPIEYLVIPIFTVVATEIWILMSSRMIFTASPIRLLRSTL